MTHASFFIHSVLVTVKSSNLEKGENIYQAKIDIFLDQHYPHFAGHFPHHPIWAGVSQLDLIQKICEKLLNNLQTSSTRIVIKALKCVRFNQLIRPETLVQLQLAINQSEQRIDWQMTTNSQPSSKGTLFYVVE